VRPYGANKTAASTPGAESVILVQGESNECSSWAWEPGDSFVIIAFNEPVATAAAGHSHWVMQPILG